MEDDLVGRDILAIILFVLIVFVPMSMCSSLMGINQSLRRMEESCSVVPQNAQDAQ